MLLLPLKANLNLSHASRAPIITTLICILCVVVFSAQLTSQAQTSHNFNVFCSQQSDRVFNLVLQNVYGVHGKTGCLEFLSSASQRQDPRVPIGVAVGDMKSFANMSMEKSKQLATQRLLDKYATYNDYFGPNLTTELAYEPTSYSLLNMFTSTVAHVDWTYLVVNLLIFFAFAASVEIALGHLRFLAAFAILAVGTAAAYSELALLMGSSTAIMGLTGIVIGMIGLYMYVMPQARISCLLWFVLRLKIVTIPAWLLAALFVGWVAFSVYYLTSLSDVILAAYLCGAVIGYLFGFLFCSKIKRRLVNWARSAERKARRMARLAQTAIPETMPEKAFSSQ